MGCFDTKFLCDQISAMICHYWWNQKEGNTLGQLGDDQTKEGWGSRIMKKGLIWRVGDGENLNMWSDPWLPRDMSRRPITPKGACLLRDVAELIDPATSRWNV
jgi:hypothetical protein